MAMEKFVFQYKQYEKSTGILYETESDMTVRLSIANNECTISANREGLLALAKSLIKLADRKVPVGTHYHMDAPVFLEEGSADLVIERI